MSTPGVILGIDAGTTGCKAVVFTPSGEVLGIGRTHVPITRGPRGETTSDMHDVWNAVVEATQGALVNAEPTQVTAVGITGQGDGAWWVAPDYSPVGPAALWLDSRAAPRLETWNDRGWTAHTKSYTGSPPFPGSLPMLVDHALTNTPHILSEAAYHLNCKDWIRLCMTGAVATDHSDASRTYLDPGNGEYSHELIEHLGHQSIAHKLAPVLSPDSVAGQVTPTAAQALGIPAGTPVVTGMMDTAAAGVGLGALDEGDTYAVLGTTAFLGTLISSKSATAAEHSFVLATGFGSQALECMSLMNGVPNLTWARDSLGWSDVDWDEVERRAAQVPAGSGGTIFLPYVATSGERAPFVDVNASAGWLGTSVTTEPAHLMRAAYEGLAYALAECLSELQVRPDTIKVCGGGASSDLLCTVLAAVTDTPIVRFDDPEVGARGAAALALAGTAGITVKQAVEHLSTQSQVFAPNADLVRIYSTTRHTFLRARNAVRDIWPDLARARTVPTNPIPQPNATEIP